MNEVPRDRSQFREGFVQATPPADKPKDLAAAMASHPGPEIADSPAELDAPAPVVTWPMVVKLSFKSIQNGKGETVDQLVFREPKGGDINRYGNPVRMNAAGDWCIEERKMHYIMAALSDILPPFLDAMDTRDWNFAAYELMRFFLPTRRVS
jgi:hypothetical protein